MVNRLKWLLAGVLIACASAGLIYVDMHRYPPGLNHVPKLALAEGTDARLVPSTAGPFDRDLEYTSGDLQMVARIVQAFRTGDFAAALRLSDAAIASDGLSAAYHSWSQAQLAVLLQAVAWQQMQSSSFEQAIVTLNRAAAIQRSPEILKQLAVCNARQRHFVLAAEHLSSYLALHPQDVGMQLLFAEVLEQTGRYGEAATTLEQLHAASHTAAAAAPYVVAAALDPRLLVDREERLKTLKASTSDPGIEHYLSSDNFHLGYPNGVNSQPARFILNVLEKALEEYADNYDLPVPLSPINVLMYAPDTFRPLTGGGAFRLEKLYDGRLRLPIKAGELRAQDFTELEQVVRHELVHALLDLKNHSMLVPPWFDEGLAQHLACHKMKCRPFTFPAGKEEFLPPAAFLTPYLALSADNAVRTYRQSHFLVMTLDAAAGPGALRRIIRGISAKRSDSSDDLLAPVHLTLANLCAIAAGYWGQRQIPDIPPGD